MSINTAAVDNPGLISSIAEKFGSQCVVVAIDTQLINNKWLVFVNSGRTATTLEASAWAEKAERLGAGEILLTSMNSDGTRRGFSTDITAHVSRKINIPVIASGGAGTMDHFREVFMETGCSAALAASIFHYGEISIPDLKDYLSKNNINIRS